MNQLTESLFHGTWRSYKAFLHSGEVKNHTRDKYKEFAFKAGKQLTIRAYDNGKIKTLHDARDWAVIFKDKRHYLSIDGKCLLYEVITINHTALVVMDIQTQEKFFCARMQAWDNYIKTPAPSAL